MPERFSTSEPRAGDDAARADGAIIVAAYREHAAELLRIAGRLTGSEADAEDLVHDLFVALPELLDGYEERGQLAAWLRGIVVRMALARGRRERRRAGLLARWFMAPASAGREAAADSPLDISDTERALGTLSPGNRAVVVLRLLEDKPFEEIAMHLGITSGAARVRYLRALEQLRATLRGEA